MPQKAVDCCAQLNEWALCVRVANEHGIPVDNLLSSRLSKLKMHGRKVDEVNLYKSAAQHHMSALALADLAKDSVVRLCPARHASQLLYTFIELGKCTTVQRFSKKTRHRTVLCMPRVLQPTTLRFSGTTSVTGSYEAAICASSLGGGESKGFKRA